MSQTKANQYVTVRLRRVQSRLLISAANRMLKDRVEYPDGPARRSLESARDALHAARDAEVASG